MSAASGAVGSVVGQLAKVHGCRAVGIAGGQAKCDHVVHELGFDACVDHRAGNLYDDLRVACPDGIDVDFENVGGAVLDTALRLMNRHSRVVLCGLVAEYSAKEPYGYQRLRSVLVNRIRMQGMIVFDWKDRYGEALPTLTSYFAEGKLKYRESIVEGLDNAPRALIALLKGENFGKQLVRIACWRPIWVTRLDLTTGGRSLLRLTGRDRPIAAVRQTSVPLNASKPRGTWASAMKAAFGGGRSQA